MERSFFFLQLFPLPPNPNGAVEEKKKKKKSKLLRESLSSDCSDSEDDFDCLLEDEIDMVDNEKSAENELSLSMTEKRRASLDAKQKLQLDKNPNVKGAFFEDEEDEPTSGVESSSESSFGVNDEDSDDEASSTVFEDKKEGMAAEGWLFQNTEESLNLVGLRIRRFFPGHPPADGTVVAFLPNERNDNAGSLWHVLFSDDDDEEDLEAEEAKLARYCFKCALKKKPTKAVMRSALALIDNGTFSLTEDPLTAAKGGPVISKDRNGDAPGSKKSDRDQSLPNLSKIDDSSSVVAAGSPPSKSEVIVIDSETPCDEVSRKADQKRKFSALEDETSSKRKRSDERTTVSQPILDLVDDSTSQAEKETNPQKEKLWNNYQEAVAWREAMLARIAALQLPGNPLDTIIHELGGIHKVAEMTGRKGRLLKDSRGNVRYRLRNVSNGITLDMQNVFERDEFMSGKKRVAILSDASSAGISLQADKRARNQQRRVHITLELSWSADRAIQVLQISVD